MKKIIVYILTIIAATTFLSAYAPQGKDFGFGIVLGEPTGLTGKIWFKNDQALALSLSNSYLGSVRVGADYLFHFNAFNSKIVNLYSGPGLAVGFGDSDGWVYKHDNRYWYKDKDETAFGARGVFGINIVPRRTPLEIFGELGVLIGLSPSGHTNVEGAIGIRYYF